MANDGPLPTPHWFYEEHPDLRQFFGLIAFVSASAEDDNPHDPVRYHAWQLSGELRDQLIDGAEHAVADLALGSDAEIGLFHYQIGPAVEGPPTYLVTLWEAAQGIAPHIGTALDFVEAAGLIWAVRKRVSDWVGRQTVKGIYAEFILPPYTLEILCAAFVRQNYEPTLPLTTQAFPVDAPLVEYKFPAWEAGHTSLVVVSAGSSDYCFTVKSDGKVSLHYRRTASHIEWLPTPQLVPNT